MHSNQAAENGILDTTSTTFGGSTMTTRIKNRSAIFDTGRKLAVSALALGLALGSSAPAWATIDNTVTVTGSSPFGTGDVTNTDTENVDVVNPVPDLQISKGAAITTDADSDLEGDAGDVITYTYTVTNNSNVTVNSVSIIDTHDGVNALAQPTFASWTTQAGSPAYTAGVDTDINMMPGAVAVFTVTYTLATGDIHGGGGGTPDGDLDNSAVAEGVYNVSGGGTATETSSASVASVPLDADASLTIAKSANDTTEVVLNQVITYTYIITNNGDVPITSITLGDVHGGSGTDPVPNPDTATLTDNGTSGDSVNPTTGDNDWDVLYPGDVLTVTATYTVTQSDIDNLQ